MKEARSLFIELVYYGPDALNFALGFKPLIEGWESLEEAGKLEGQLSQSRELIAGHFRHYDAQVDEAILAALLSPYVAAIHPDLCPEVLKDFDGNGTEFARSLYAKSVFADREALEALLDKGQAKGFSKLQKDPLYVLINALRSAYFEQVATEYRTTKMTVGCAHRTIHLGTANALPRTGVFPGCQQHHAIDLWKSRRLFAV